MSRLSRYFSLFDLNKLFKSALQSSLIITPPSLVSQWMDELTNNAPSLRVLVYDGWCKWKDSVAKAARAIQKKKERSKPKKRKGKAKGKGKAKADTDDSETSDDYGSDSKPSSTNELDDWAEYVHQYDVVITTYSVLRSEIWVAKPPLNRPRREDAVYASDPSRSPLVLVKWKRVVMDEVQMVGGGQAA